jgi:hypothetical protein
MLQTTCYIESSTINDDIYVQYADVYEDSQGNVVTITPDFFFPEYIFVFEIEPQPNKSNLKYVIVQMDFRIRMEAITGLSFGKDFFFILLLLLLPIAMQSFEQSNSFFIFQLIIACL